MGNRQPQYCIARPLLEQDMQHAFCLIPNQLYGRSGPNLDPWIASELAAGGIGAILSVNSGDSVYLDELEQADINHQCTPLAAQAPPQAGELELCLERLPVAFRFVRQQIAGGRAVLVHCRHGKDRTGLFMAYYLHQHLGLAPAQAISEVKRVRPIALSADGWDSFALNILNRCP